MPIRGESSAELIPFEPTSGDGLRLQARVRRDGSRLDLEYTLAGELGALLIPELASAPSRQDLLWQHTCFEAFISESGQSFYWELNFSPSLDWNCYHFRGYREGMRPEKRLSAPKSAVESGRDRLGFRVELDLGSLLPGITHLDLGLTAVIERRDGTRSFWALKHVGEKPDFHLRKSFSLRI